MFISNKYLSFFNTIKGILIIIAFVIIINKLPTPYLLFLMALINILDSIEFYREKGKLPVFKIIIIVACIVLAIFILSENFELLNLI